ncbi:MAG: mechanosensitive ion channel [Oscillospiraceae bacterium]|nr:mechanosensitive ion channel [Oscillospiraceae bacterium]
MDLDLSEMNFNDLDYGVLSKVSIGSMALSTLISAILTFLACFVVIQLVLRALERILKRASRLDATLKGFILSSVRILLWILTGIIVAGALGIPTTSLVALISIVGLALSLSVQNILSNLFSGLTLLISKPFRAGDYVEAAGKAGTVKAVGLFYTQLNTLDNIFVSIPNSDVTGTIICNYSREPLRRVDRIFSASYDSSTDDVKAAVSDAISRDIRILQDPPPFVRLSDYKDSCIEYTVRVWCRTADYWDVFFNLNENVRECFAAKGVEMTYNHMNVHILDR